MGTPRQLVRSSAGVRLKLFMLAFLALSRVSCTGGSQSAGSPAPQPQGRTQSHQVGQEASPSQPPESPGPTPQVPPLFQPAPRDEPGHLQPGSDPSALPAPVLIADRNNNRLVVVDPEGRVLWQFPQPGDLQPGQQFLIPDDAFFTPDGKEIIATHEGDFVVTAIDVASRRIVWQYGQPGVHGSGPNHLWNPDDAIALPNGDVVTADIKNCRVLLVAEGSHQPLRSFGRPGQCIHRPPADLGSPNGAFPMKNGHFLVTEIDGDWVDELTPDGQVVFSTHAPGVIYPSDSNEIAPGRYLTADYSQPGKLVMFDQSGDQLWRFEPSGPNGLNHPSIALPLRNGKVIATDDRNDRVIVVDPKSNQIVWQYGETGKLGDAPGLLNNPDGLDLVPPDSFIIEVAGKNGQAT